MTRNFIPLAAIALLAACGGNDANEDVEIDTTAPSEPFDDEVPVNTILEEDATPNPEAEPGDALETDSDS